MAPSTTPKTAVASVATTGPKILSKASRCRRGSSLTWSSNPGNSSSKESTRYNNKRIKSETSPPSKTKDTRKLSARWTGPCKKSAIGNMSRV